MPDVVQLVGLFAVARFNVDVKLLPVQVESRLLVPASCTR